MNESMRDRFHRTVAALLDERDDTVAVVADIGAAQLAAAARAHPGRVVNVGIREQAMLGVAGGLALAGMRPVVHSYAPFLVERAYEQVKLDLGHQDVGAVLVSTGGSYDASAEGRTHQAPADVALVQALPGWTVHVPGHPDELEEALRLAVAGTGRVYIRMTGRSTTRAFPVDGRLHLVRDEGGASDRGSDGGGVLVVAVGDLLDRVLDATAGLPVRVAATTTPHPLDGDGLRSLTGPRPRVVVVEPYLAGTSAAAVARALVDVPSRVLHLGVDGSREHRVYGSPEDHDRLHGLDVPGIRGAVERFVGLGDETWGSTSMVVTVPTVSLAT
jgi:transketolase